MLARIPSYSLVRRMLISDMKFNLGQEVISLKKEEEYNLLLELILDSTAPPTLPLSPVVPSVIPSEQIALERPSLLKIVQLTMP